MPSKRKPSDVLRDALPALAALKKEMPQSIVLIGQCERQVTSVIEAYDAMRADLIALQSSTRKPPQRVPMRARRPAVRVTTTNRTTPTAPLDSMHNTNAAGVELEGPYPDRHHDE